MMGDPTTLATGQLRFYHFAQLINATTLFAYIAWTVTVPVSGHCRWFARGRTACSHMAAKSRKDQPLKPSSRWSRSGIDPLSIEVGASLCDLYQG